MTEKINIPIRLRILNIQDWPDADKTALLNVVKKAIGKTPYQDICVVGSRVIGCPHPKLSDVDVVVFTGPSVPERTYFKAWFFKSRVTIHTLHNSKKRNNHKGFLIPKYSLITGTLYDVDATGINNWIDERIAKAAAGFPREPWEIQIGVPSREYDWTEGRDFSNLIVKRRA